MLLCPSKCSSDCLPHHLLFCIDYVLEDNTLFYLLFFYYVFETWCVFNTFTTLQTLVFRHRDLWFLGAVLEGTAFTGPVSSFAGGETEAGEGSLADESL